MQLTTAVLRYLDNCKARGISAQTLTNYRSDLMLLVKLAAVRAKDSILAFTPELAQAFMLEISAKNLSIATLARRRASLTGFARFGVRKRFWLADPTADLGMIRKPKTLPRPFSGEELAALTALELPVQQRAIRALLIFTGLRVTPICRLRIGDLSFSDTTFRSGLVAPGSVRAVSKGRKVSVKPMHAALWTALRDYLVESHPTMDRAAFLFGTRAGNPWHRKRIEKITRAWGEAADVADCHPHRFRHAFATMLLDGGADLRMVQELMDHEDPRSTAIYTKVSDERTARAVLNLPDFGLDVTGRTSVPTQDGGFENLRNYAKDK